MPRGTATPAGAVFRWRHRAEQSPPFGSRTSVSPSSCSLVTFLVGILVVCVRAVPRAIGPDTRGRGVELAAPAELCAGHGASRFRRVELVHGRLPLGRPAADVLFRTQKSRFPEGKRLLDAVDSLRVPTSGPPLARKASESRTPVLPSWQGATRPGLVRGQKGAERKSVRATWSGHYTGAGNGAEPPARHFLESSYARHIETAARRRHVSRTRGLLSRRDRWSAGTPPRYRLRSRPSAWKSDADCTGSSGSNVVRSPDGIHFCPVGKVTIRGRKDICDVYSSGAFRFAAAMLSAALHT
jgi:hypothetical protein